MSRSCKKKCKQIRTLTMSSTFSLLFSTFMVGTEGFLPKFFKIEMDFSELSLQKKWKFRLVYILILLLSTSLQKSITVIYLWWTGAAWCWVPLKIQPFCLGAQIEAQMFWRQGYLVRCPNGSCWLHNRQCSRFLNCDPDPFSHCTLDFQNSVAIKSI